MHIEYRRKLSFQLQQNNTNMFQIVRMICHVAKRTIRSILCLLLLHCDIVFISSFSTGKFANYINEIMSSTVIRRQFLSLYFIVYIKPQYIYSNSLSIAITLLISQWLMFCINDPAIKDHLWSKTRLFSSHEWSLNTGLTDLLWPYWVLKPPSKPSMWILLTLLMYVNAHSPTSHSLPSTEITIKTHWTFYENSFYLIILPTNLPSYHA